MVWSAGPPPFSLESGRKRNSYHSLVTCATATTPGTAAAAIFDDALVKCAVFTKYYRKYSLRLARYRYGAPHIYFYCICLHMIK